MARFNKYWYDPILSRIKWASFQVLVLDSPKPAKWWIHWLLWRTGSGLVHSTLLLHDTSHYRKWHCAVDELWDIYLLNSSSHRSHSRCLHFWKHLCRDLKSLGHRSITSKLNRLCLLFALNPFIWAIAAIGHIQILILAERELRAWATNGKPSRSTESLHEFLTYWSIILPIDERVPLTCAMWKAWSNLHHVIYVVEAQYKWGRDHYARWWSAKHVYNSWRISHGLYQLWSIWNIHW